jgi:transcriptional regulator with XRE-family HTH domain
VTDEQLLGLRLEEFLTVHDLKQVALAQIVGVEQGYLNQIVRGHKRISSTVIFGISKRFTDLNLNWLIRGVGDMLLVEADHPAPAEVSRVDEAPAVYLARRSGILEDMQDRIADLEATVAKMKAKK